MFDFYILIGGSRIFKVHNGTNQPSTGVHEGQEEERGAPPPEPRPGGQEEAGGGARRPGRVRGGVREQARRVPPPVR